MKTSDRERPLYMISVAAELAGLHPQTLRIYEAKGLVCPKRTAGNTRMYSQADIERLELIGQLTSEGINLAGVIRILDFEDRLQAKEEEMDELRQRATRLENIVHEYEMRQHITNLTQMGQVKNQRLLSAHEDLTALQSGAALQGGATLQSGADQLSDDIYVNEVGE